jgi:hypothetical protein
MKLLNVEIYCLEYYDCKFAIKGLYQRWPTQIGLWAAIVKITENIGFLGHIPTKTVRKTSKVSKNH